MILREYLNRLSETCRLVLLEKYHEILDKEITLPEKLNEISKILKVLSNPVRLKIVWLLAEHDMPVCLIATILNKDQTLISHHLRVLKEHGIVKENAIGKFKYYITNKTELRKILETLIRDLK